MHGFECGSPQHLRQSQALKEGPYSAPGQARSVRRVQEGCVSEYGHCILLILSPFHSKRFYTAIKDDPELQVKLTGSWETLVGEQDTFLHVLEYENYAGYDKTTRMIQASKVRIGLLVLVTLWLIAPQEYSDAYKAMLPFINTRSTQLNQEFAFFPTAPPHTEGGLFELRSYQLKPGTLLEWETTWCVPWLDPALASLTRLVALTGDAVLKRAVSSSLRLVPGSLKLVGCTKRTISGSTRMFFGRCGEGIWN